MLLGIRSMPLTRVLMSTSSIETPAAPSAGCRSWVELVGRHAETGRQRALRVEVDQQHPAAVLGERGAQVDRRRGLADAALLVAQRDDLRRAVPVLRLGSGIGRGGRPVSADGPVGAAARPRSCADATVVRRSTGRGEHPGKFNGTDDLVRQTRRPTSARALIRQAAMPLARAGMGARLHLAQRRRP